MLRLNQIGDTKKVFEISKEKEFLSIGREEKNNIIIENDSNVSRQHGEVFLKDGNYYYKDLGSTNGTIIIRKEKKIFLDGEQLCQIGLKDKDILICGDTAFLIETDVKEKEGIELFEESDSTKTIILSQNVQDIDRIKSSVHFEGKTLETLYEMCTYLQSTLDINTVLDNIGNAILKVIEKCENVFVILGEITSPDIAPIFYKSRNNANKSEGSPLSKTILRRVYYEGDAFLIEDTIKEYNGIASIYNAQIRSVLCVPLWDNKNIIGVIQVDNRILNKAFTETDLKILTIFAYYAAIIAINNASLFEGLQRSNVELTLAYDTTIEGWSRAMDLRDKETEGHTQRVAEMTLRIARELEIKEEELVHMRRGALLHDMGKMGIPDNILLKPDRLTEKEWEVMKRHPEYAYDMLYPIEYLRPALDIPYYHHEKWDGTGYPKGLKGEEIPPAARIFAVVDVWDALCSDRPYRPAWPKKKVREHIRSIAGTHFDPKVVGVFLKIDW
jgi:pSer/pThr/pTyr-binding forkhead associated (FHA) protein